MLFQQYNVLDINECEAQPHPCSPNGRCVNSDGDFTCECSNGWTGYNCLTGKTKSLVYSIGNGRLAKISTIYPDVSLFTKLFPPIRMNTRYFHDIMHFRIV